MDEYYKITDSLHRIKGVVKIYDTYFNILFCHYHDEKHIPKNDFHSHNFFELHIILEGKYQSNYGANNYSTYEKDEFWIIYPDTVHQRTKIDSECYREIAIAFEWFRLENDERKNVFQPYNNDRVIHGYITTHIGDLINQILTDAIYNSEMSLQKTFLQMHLLAIEFYNLVYKKNNEIINYNNNIQNTRLKNICIYIYDNLNIINSGADVAETFGLSVRQLDRIFTANFNQTLSAYIKQQKINAGKRLLETTSLPIKEIGVRVGFNSPNAFSRFFESCTSMTPSRYRKLNRESSDKKTHYSITHR